jgi:hypothetical protein
MDLSQLQIGGVSLEKEIKMAAAVGPAAVQATRALTRAAPGVTSRVMQYIRTATGGRVGDTAKQVAQYAAQSKNSFALVAEAMVRSGIPVNEVFTSSVLSQLRDQELRQLYEKLKNEFGAVYGRIDADSSFKATSDANRDVIALENIGYISRRFGVNGAADLKALHAHLKIFMAMDEAQLAQALSLRAAARGTGMAS